MNLPNLLTISRLPLLLIIAVFLLFFDFRGSGSVALFFFTIAGLSDWLDGKIARDTGQVSNFGKLMDALTDKVLVIGLFTTFFVMQPPLLPLWTFPFLLLILCREFLVTGLRLVAASKGIVLAAEKSGKQKMVSQITAAATLLVYHAASNDFQALVPEGVLQALLWIGVIAFLVAAVLTISSGTFYLKKYWSVFEESAPKGTGGRS